MSLEFLVFLESIDEGVEIESFEFGDEGELGWLGLEFELEEFFGWWEFVFLDILYSLFKS